MKTSRRQFLGGSLVTLSTFAGRGKSHPRAKASVGEGVQVATFVADVTPPIGSPLDCGLSAPVSLIEHPLFAKGVVLRDGDGTYVLCAVDWEGLCNDAYDLLRERIGKAAGTSPSRVAVQALHLHTAPCVDSNAQKLLDREMKPPRHADLKFLDTAASQIAAAVGEATRRWRALTHVGRGWAAVDQVASTRRILQPDGTILVRYSSAKDPDQQKAPEGTIDGYLRTISFFDGERPLVHIHYYATHPQSYYGDGRVTYDVPGMARERLEKESGVFQIYFTGCGGNVAMGKYNDGTPERRPALADRLHDGMVRAVKSVQREPVSSIGWKSIDVHFSPRSDPAFSEEANRKVLSDANAPANSRLNAAMNLACSERIKQGRPFQLSCLSIGHTRILHLPGEPFVEYQLWAQQLHPGLFVAVAGYGDCAMWYICTDKAYSDVGGYEQTWSFIDPSEKLLKETMARLLIGPAAS